MKNCVITIDGPAGSGKSTVAKLLAQKLSYDFLDTGAMYRAVTFAVMDADVDFDDKIAVKQILEQSCFDFRYNRGVLSAFWGDKNITTEIRRTDVTQNVSKIACLDFVRDKLVEMQRAFAKNAGSIVTEGRDQGTVVFPDAMVKFFLTADVAERANRRYQELKAKGCDVDIAEIEKAIEERDKSDMQREIAPLIKADDAVEIDTTGLGIDGVVSRLLEVVADRELTKD